MRYLGILPAILMLLGAVRAGEDPLEAQIIALAKASAKAEIALRKGETLQALARPLDEGWQRIEQLRVKMKQVFEKRIEAEQNKPEMDRMPETIAALRDRSEGVEDDHHTAELLRRGLLDRFQTAMQRFQAAHEVYAAAQQLERPMKAAQMDLALIQQLYEQTAKMMDDARAAAEGASAEMQALVKSWETKLAELTAPPKPPDAKPGEKPVEKNPF
jgi:hypothetical protein